jgi:hypothetical protein
VNSSLIRTMPFKLFPRNRPDSSGLRICRSIFIAMALCAGAAMAQPSTGGPDGGPNNLKPRIIVTTDLGARQRIRHRRTDRFDGVLEEEPA